MNNNLDTKLGLGAKLVNLKKSWTCLVVVKTLRILTILYPIIIAHNIPL